jgi:hypothetical protein
LRPAAEKLVWRLAGHMRQGLAQASTKQEQRDDGQTLERPKRIKAKVLRWGPQTMQVQIKAEVKDRHPHHGQASQCIQSIDTGQNNTARLWNHGDTNSKNRNKTQHLGASR